MNQKPFETPILVTRPYLPDIKEYQEGLCEIWEHRWLTNNGPVLRRYEKNLQSFFGTSCVCAFNNGTLALQIALQGLKIEGEVITTPFTFVATSHCLVWNKIRPVFVDIDPVTYTISPEAVEAAITPRTSAILAVHVFGTPCNLDALQRIADKHHLALVYDAAHALGVKVANGQTGTSPGDGSYKDIGLYGDCSMFSLHATKLYHSIEGGLLTFKDGAYKKVFEYLRNFGFENETEVMMIGTNAKMNEFQALMGDLILPALPSIIAKRERLSRAYYEGLKDIPGIDVHLISDAVSMAERTASPGGHPGGYTPNFAYVPVEVRPEYGVSRDALYEKLKKYNVYSRRYFYPLLTDFACYQVPGVADIRSLTVAREVAERIITLPIYFDLDERAVDQICAIVRQIRL